MHDIATLYLRYLVFFYGVFKILFTSTTSTIFDNFFYSSNCALMRISKWSLNDAIFVWWFAAIL